MIVPLRRPSVEPAVSDESVRQHVTEHVLERVERVVEREVRRHLRFDSLEVRQLRDCVYSDLGSRLVFERERLRRT